MALILHVSFVYGLFHRLFLLYSRLFLARYRYMYFNAICYRNAHVAYLLTYLLVFFYTALLPFQFLLFHFNLKHIKTFTVQVCRIKPAVCL